MTKVKIEPGICGFTTTVRCTADEDDDTELTVRVATGCESVKKMMVWKTWCFRNSMPPSKNSDWPQVNDESQNNGKAMVSWYLMVKKPRFISNKCGNMNSACRDFPIKVIKNCIKSAIKKPAAKIKVATIVT